MVLARSNGTHGFIRKIWYHGFAGPPDIYAVYFSAFREGTLDLTGASGNFIVQWYSPRKGGDLIEGSVKEVSGGGPVSPGAPPDDPDQDWVLLVKKR